MGRSRQDGDTGLDARKVGNHTRQRAIYRHISLAQHLQNGCREIYHDSHDCGRNTGKISCDREQVEEGDIIDGKMEEATEYRKNKQKNGPG